MDGENVYADLGLCVHIRGVQSLMYCRAEPIAGWDRVKGLICLFLVYVQRSEIFN